MRFIGRLVLVHTQTASGSFSCLILVAIFGLDTWVRGYALNEEMRRLAIKTRSARESARSTIVHTSKDRELCFILRV